MGYYDDAYDSFLGTSTQGSSEVANPDVFLEAYYGKLPEFEEIEKLLGIMMQKARKDPYKSNPNKWEENAKIQKLFCKIFGFKATYIYWIPDNVPNAFTITLYSLMLFGDTKDFIEKRSDRGFYDSSKTSVLTVYGYTGLLLDELNLTPRELLSIILHEIGHNFDFSAYHLISYWINNIATLGLYGMWTKKHLAVEDLADEKMNYYYQFKDHYDETFEDPEARKKEDEANKKIMDRYRNRGKLVLSLEALATLITTMIYTPVAIPIQLLNLDGKMGELFADSFATAYGYGQELISGLEKLGSNKGFQYKDNSKTAVFLRDLNRTMNEILNGMIEIHGSNQERAKESLKKLKVDLKTCDYPAGMREELEKEIARVESYYNTMIHATEGEKMTIQKRWRRFCEKFFGGSLSISRLFKQNKV